VRKSLVWVAVVPILVIATGCAPSANEQPTCRSDPPTLLMAESVATASLIPCVDALPQGWTWHSFQADDASATFSLEQQDGDGALEVALVGACDVSGDGEPVQGFPSAERYRSVNDTATNVTWTSTFPGGCARTSLTFSSRPEQTEVDRMQRAISFIPRDQLRPE
jgi:hypothetical protein